MKSILCYNEDFCDIDGFDNVAQHPDATIIELTNETECEIVKTMIEKIHHSTRRRSVAGLIFEIRSLFDVSVISGDRFDQLFSAIISHDFVDLLD